MWNTIPSINTVISLIAFALAVILSVMVAYLRSKRRKIPSAFWAVILALVSVSVIATLYRPGDIYRIRVTVLNPQQVPVEDAKVWSSFGGEPKKVAGGWQFDIPSASKPQDSKLTIFASQENAFLTGQGEVALTNDYNATLIIKLARDDSAKVHGQIVDGNNQAIAGARVFVVGYESEALITKEGGNFELPAHAAVNQLVLLHAEKPGYRAVMQRHPAGDAPAVLMLER